MSKDLKHVIIDGVKHSLDDMPAITRQLGLMLRRHRMQQRRNNDGVTGIDRYDGDVKRVKVTVKAFKRNKKHDSAEFKRQHDEQMEQLQKLSLKEWLENRKNYNDKGRTSDSLRAQQDARDLAYREMYDQLRDSGMNKDAAEKAAKDWMKTQAATHRLDGIAGGNATDISGLGDTRINSSLGSQWRTRVSEIQATVDQFVKDNPGVDLSTVFLDLNFR